MVELSEEEYSHITDILDGMVDKINIDVDMNTIDIWITDHNVYFHYNGDYDFQSHSINLKDRKYVFETNKVLPYLKRKITLNNLIND